MMLAAYKKISKALYADLDAVYAKHGFEVSKMSAGVDEFAGTVRLTVTLADSNLKDKSGAPTTPEAERFKHCASMLGMKPEWLGRTFRFGLSAESYTLLGMREGRSEKCIVLLRASDKKRLVSQPEGVIGAFTRVAAKVA